MVASYDGALEVWQPFSRERQLLDDAMEVVRSLPSSSRINARERISREMQRVAADTASEAVGMSDTAALGSLELESRSYRARIAVGFVSQLQEYASSTRTSVLGTLDALHQVVRATSAVAGRKAVILVSDDLEVVPGQILSQRWEEFFPDVARTNIVSPLRDAQQFDLGSRVEDLVKTSNTHRVSLFAIGAVDDRQLKRLGAESGGSSLGLGFGSPQHFGGARALAYITGITGGRVVPNGSSLDDHLAGVLRELDSYYSLAFETQRAGDGRYHRLRVEVDQRKARLRYREGYRDRSHEDVLADQTVAAAVLGITDNRLKIALEVDPMKRLGDDRSEVPVRIRVPLNQLGLRATGSHHVGKITVFMVVRDERGGSSRTLQHDFPLEIDNESLLSAFGRYADFVMGVVMRDGKHRLAVGVRDQFGNVDATATLDVIVGNDNG
jgi:VWFA-related protein